MKAPAVIAIAWCHFQPRTLLLAKSLNGSAEFVVGDLLASRHVGLPLRYVLSAVQMWRTLEARQPDVALVITPPVFAPLVAWLWCRVRRRQLVIDCHTDTFHSRKWKWANPLNRLLIRRSTVALVHTEEAEALAKSWSTRVLLLPDDIPGANQALPQPRGRSPRVVVAGGLDDQEPVEQTLQTAALLPDVEFILTGDQNRLPNQLRETAPPNVIFSGYLPYPEFLGQLCGADVVAAFSLDPHIMNRAAFEAIGLGRPLVLSDFPGLRVRFADAPIFCTNEPAAMAAAISQALAQAESLAERSRAAQVRLRQHHKDALSQLRDILGMADLVPIGV